LQQLASKAYGQVTQRTANEKQIEFALFQQITDQLEEVEQAEAPAPAIWADAIDRNLQLWTMLMADLLLPENALPIDTKQSLLNVAHFVRRHSMQLLSGNGELADLIEVNRTIMAGISPARGNLGEVAA
jgi:flagellar protein FlaF